MAKIIKVKDEVRLPSFRPPHWSKDGSMDVFLGKLVVVTSTYEYMNKLDGTFKFVTKEGSLNSGSYQFLMSDIDYSPSYVKDCNPSTSFQPYMLPLEGIVAGVKEHQKYTTEDKPLLKTYNPVIGDIVYTLIPWKVFRDHGDGFVDIHDVDGNCIKTSKKAIFQLFNQSAIMKARKQACLTVAKELLKANNTVTTLEVKSELIRDYPYYFWDQTTVSAYMEEFANEGIFQCTYNGTYRIYSSVPLKVQAQTAGPVSSQVAANTISKVAGTISTSGKKTKAKVSSAPLNIKPSKNTKSVSRGAAALMAHNADFESVTLDNKVVTRADIRAQKKSPSAYLSASKLSRVTAITVSGKTYRVV